MPNVVINRCADLCVLSVHGHLITEDDTLMLVDSLLHVVNDSLVILDLTRSTAVSHTCAQRLGRILDEHHRNHEFVVVVDHREVSERLLGAAIDRSASMCHSLDAAVARVGETSSLEILLMNLTCSDESAG